MAFDWLWIGFLLLLTSVLQSSSALLFLTDRSLQIMVMFSSPDLSCKIVTDRMAVIKLVLTMPADSMVRAVDDEEMIGIMDACEQHNSVTPSMSGGFVYPGTKWCGPGSVARNYDDLGVLTKVDRCCREHDNCPVSLSAGECNNNGICNQSPFTRSECKCDTQFQSCLKRVRTNTADTIGAIYFNIVRVMCFTDTAECGRKPNTCQMRVMPYYKANSELRNLKMLIAKLFRGFVRLKQAILKPRQRLF